MEPGFFSGAQWQDNSQGAHWNTGASLDIREHFFTGRVTEHWNRLHISCSTPLLGNAQQPSGHCPGEHAVGDPAWAACWSRWPQPFCENGKADFPGIETAMFFDVGKINCFMPYDVLLSNKSRGKRRRKKEEDDILSWSLSSPCVIVTGEALLSWK